MEFQDIIAGMGERESGKMLMALAIIAVFVFFFGLVWLKAIRNKHRTNRDKIFVEDSHVVSSLPDAGREFNAAVQKSTVAAATLKNILVVIVCSLATCLFGIMFLVDLFDSKRILSGQIFWTLIPALVSGYVARSAYSDVRKKNTTEQW